MPSAFAQCRSRQQGFESSDAQLGLRGDPRRGCGDPLSRTSLVSRHNPPREHVVSCATGTTKKAHMVVFLHRRGTDFVGKMKGRYFGLFFKETKRMCEGVSMQPKKASLVILSVQS